MERLIRRQVQWDRCGTSYVTDDSTTARKWLRECSRTTARHCSVRGLSSGEELHRSARLVDGGVSERPKEHASKACEGATPPWVQIPPPPLFFSAREQ